MVMVLRGHTHSRVRRVGDVRGAPTQHAAERRRQLPATAGDAVHMGQRLLAVLRRRLAGGCAVGGWHGGVVGGKGGVVVVLMGAAVGGGGGLAEAAALRWQGGTQC